MLSSTCQTRFRPNIVIATAHHHWYYFRSSSTVEHLHSPKRSHHSLLLSQRTANFIAGLSVRSSLQHSAVVPTEYHHTDAHSFSLHYTRSSVLKT